jgi:hypothetical protein
MRANKNDYVICVDDNSPIDHANKSPVLKLGELYQILEVQHYPGSGTCIYKVKNTNTGKSDWFHADRFTFTKRET